MGWVLISRLSPLLILGVFALVQPAHAAPTEAQLQVEADPVIHAILQEYRQPGSTPEIYLLSEKYRLDLTVLDLVDQVTLLTRSDAEVSKRLKAAFLSARQFAAWFEELNTIAAENADLQRRLNRKLRPQFYALNGAALSPEYKKIDLHKIKDNDLLVRIHRYNDIALDPEGRGLLAAFERSERAPFFTRALTVSKLDHLKGRELKKLHSTYYGRLLELYRKHDPDSEFIYQPRRRKIEAWTTDSSLRAAQGIFNVINHLPNKQEILFYVAHEVKGVPYESGLLVLTPKFIGSHFAEVNAALKSYTLAQVVNSPDDEYLLGLRRWIRKNTAAIETAVTAYNSTNRTAFVLFYENREKLPKRVEAILDHEFLQKIYPDLPWLERERGTIVDEKGREKYYFATREERIGHLFKSLGRELIQTETYVSVLVGTSAFILTQGNMTIALGSQKLAKQLVEKIRYDREWKEFLKKVPADVLNAFMVSAGFSAGRFFKIVALGAAQGAIQSTVTGQDIRTGAAVGVAFNLLGYYVLPAEISRPMTKGFDAKALATNRRLEFLEKTVRASLQGATVAALTEEPIVGSALKGAGYGIVSTQLMIWLLGTRYNPFKDFEQEKIDDVIRLENEYQNKVGRGGLYAIDRQLILDANYRVGGVLPDLISASITLPGNVAMSDGGFKRLTTLTHEAHHLMQQHQSGVFAFYLFRYLPTALKTGYAGHPDENFLH